MWIGYVPLKVTWNPRSPPTPLDPQLSPSHWSSPYPSPWPSPWLSPWPSPWHPLGYPLGPPLGYLLGPRMKGNFRMSLDPPHSIFFYPLNIQLSKNVTYNLFTRIYNQLSFLLEPGPSSLELCKDTNTVLFIHTNIKISLLPLIQKSSDYKIRVEESNQGFFNIWNKVV